MLRRIASAAGNRNGTSRTVQFEALRCLHACPPARSTTVDSTNALSTPDAPHSTTHTLPSQKQSFGPGIYRQIREHLSDPSATDHINAPQPISEQLDAIRRAQDAVAKGSYPLLQPNSTSKKARKPYHAFLERLKADGGDKIITFKRNYLHTEYTRFLPLCDQVKGLTLDQALLQIRWLRKPITKKMEDALKEAIVKAKEQNLDLSKTYVADAYVKKNAAILQSQMVKRYLRGRGRYGATPHPITTLLEITLQERDKPFAMRTKDPLEWVRDRLRERQKPFVKSAEELYIETRKKRPIKEVYC